VNAWTCNDPDRIRWLAEQGVDAVITDVPDVALAALGRDGVSAG
jgi:glycerophosphoryl diester phosphodiesterase